MANLLPFPPVYGLVRTLRQAGPPASPRRTVDAASEKVCPTCGARYDEAATFCQREGAALVRWTEEVDPYIGRTLLDQFRIEQILGAGGMGTVYRARQTTIDRDVAIKILHPELVQNPDAVRRFHREARVSASLDHPNVVRVFLFGQLSDKSLYLVMEYLRGRSLLDVLRMDGVLDPLRALHVATQICDGVGEAHRLGVVHRDVKPENVLLVTRGHDPDFVKVLDFGIARFLRDETTVATQSGLIFGTARYISPEGASGEPTDARSDVYSIAVLTYQLLCGETPFDASSPVGLLMKHIHDTPPDLRRKPQGAHVPGEVADVIMGALSKNPDLRPADANALGAALRAAALSARLSLGAPRYSVPPAAWHPASIPPSGRTPAPAPSWGGASAPVYGGSPQPYPGAPAYAGTPTPTTDPMFAGGSSGVMAQQTSISLRSIPGARRRLGTLSTLLVAFVLGAAVVGGGAFLLEGLTGGGAVALEDLESRARAALGRGDIDTPPGDNVADLTARILEREPDHAGARTLRSEAARRLREEAAMVQQQGFVDEARARYRRALALVPDDILAQRALESIEAVSTAPVVTTPPGIRVAPEEPSAGEQIDFVAALDPSVRLGADAAPSFRIERRGRQLTRALAAEEDEDGHFVASYRFAGQGTFEVVFTAGGEERLRRELTVAPARSARREDPPSTTQAGSRRARAEPAVTMDTTPGDGIDWRLPEERAPEPPPIESHPLPPPPEPEPEPAPAEEAPPAEPPQPWSSTLL